MLALPLTLLALVALAATAPATGPADADAIAPTDSSPAPPAHTAPARGVSSPLAPTFKAASAQFSAAGPATGDFSPLELIFEAESDEEEAPQGELGAGEDMEGAENIVFKPLFRYRERGGFRRRVRAASRRRDATYRRTYAARFPHHRYRPSPKRRNALHTRHQILF